MALNGALFVNAAILIYRAAVFFKHGVIVTEIQQAHLLLTPLLGATAAQRVCSRSRCCARGQSSTLTGTMAGQIVMEGFLHFRMRPWLRPAHHAHRSPSFPRPDHRLLSPATKARYAADHPEPGDSQHAASLRGHPADSLH